MVHTIFFNPVRTWPLTENNIPGFLMIMKCSTALSRQAISSNVTLMRVGLRDSQEGGAMRMLALSCSPHVSSFLECSQSLRHFPMKHVTFGSFHWRFMALGGLVSSDKLQRLPNACPNLFNFTPRYSLGRLKLPWLCGQSEEAGFDSDLRLKLSTRALSSWSESLRIGPLVLLFSTKFIGVRSIWKLIFNQRLMGVGLRKLPYVNCKYEHHLYSMHRYSII